MSAEHQTDLLATYIMNNVPNEPSRSEGAGECAIRLLKYYRQVLEQIAQLLQPSSRVVSNLDEAYDLVVGALESAFVE